MDILDRYYELEEIISNLKYLINEINTKTDIEFFKNIIEDYEKEKDEIDIQLEKEAEEEIKERQKEYWESQF